MPFAEEMVPAAVLADSAMRVLIDDRIFPAGGGTRVACPYMTFQRASTVGSNHLTGGGNLDQVRMSLTAWAKTGLEALQVAGAARQLIAPEEGDGLGTYQNQQAPSFDPETGHWGVLTDYFIWQERT